MCGRLSQSTAAEKVIKVMRIMGSPPTFLGARYNVAPSQYVYAIRQPVHGENHWAVFRWGLVPHWAKDKKIGYKMFNARAETLAEKPSFRNAYRYRRCLIPADNFFEWQTIPGQKKKLPWEIRLTDGRPMLFAGLWETWEGEGEVIESCTIVTTDANDNLQALHDRMPVIISPEQADLWLDPDMQNPEKVQSLLVPVASDEIEMDPAEPEKLSTKTATV